MPTRPLRFTLLLATLPLAAQQGAIVFKHYRHTAPGQYRQQLQGFRDGQPTGAPITQTTCTDPTNPARVAAAADMVNRAAAMQNCTMHLLRDEETVAESEQVCNPGTPMQQTIHHTMHAIDDKTQKVEVVSTVGTHKTTMLSTVTYLGPCTAEQKAENAAAPTFTMPKPTKEECAEFAASKSEAESTLKSCNEAPAEYRPRCISAMQSGLARLNVALQACSR